MGECNKVIVPFGIFMTKIENEHLPCDSVTLYSIRRVGNNYKPILQIKAEL